MSPFAVILFLSLCGLSMAQTTEPSSEDMMRSFMTIDDDDCAEGFKAVRQDGCIVRCINESDPSDVVEAFFIVRKQENGCTIDTYINGQFPCDVKVKCD